LIVVLGIPKWFMIVALSDGVGLNRLQLVMTTPTCLGETPVLFSSSDTAEKQQIWGFGRRRQRRRVGRSEGA
jgi:hypothetical protein